MNKKMTLCAVLLAAAGFVNAQTTVQDSKLLDNWFVGVDGGGHTPTAHSAFFKNTRGMAGLKVGRYVTPVLGIRADGQFYTNVTDSKTAFDASNVTLDGLFNFNNLFAGYPGEPRRVELVGILGAGWLHTYGEERALNKLSLKGGLQLNFNLGASKAWQINIEPAIVYYGGGGNGYSVMNINRSFCQLTAGLTYKFGCSNGTHNFALAELYNQSEIDAMNAKINSQYDALKQKDVRIEADAARLAALRRQLLECESAPKTVVQEKVTETTLAPVVIFAQGKSTISPSQAPSVQMIATYMKNHPEAKVTIKGYASPEGNPELNQKLSEARANAVKTMLVNRYRISANRLSVVGLGATNEVFDESDWNRVCVFVEDK